MALHAEEIKKLNKVNILRKDKRKKINTLLIPQVKDDLPKYGNLYW